MDFYRLKQPGSEWFSRQGDVIKASKAAGVDWEKVEVPDSKPDRLEWLNANARGGITPMAVEAEDIPLTPPAGKEEACPKCKWTPRMCDGYVKMKLQSLTMDAIREFIEQKEGWELSSVIEAITSRLSDLVKLAGKKPS